MPVGYITKQTRRTPLPREFWVNVYTNDVSIATYSVPYRRRNEAKIWQLSHCAYRIYVKLK